MTGPANPGPSGPAGPGPGRTVTTEGLPPTFPGSPPGPPPQPDPKPQSCDRPDDDLERRLDEAFGPAAAYWADPQRVLPLLPLPFAPSS